MFSKLEPVRSYIYSLLTPLVAVLIAYGIMDEKMAAVWVGLATAILGIGATEVARAKVTPMAKYK